MVQLMKKGRFTIPKFKIHINSTNNNKVTFILLVYFDTSILLIKTLFEMGNIETNDWLFRGVIFQ